MADDVTGLKRRRSHETLFSRLVANMHEPENDRACWLWKRRLNRNGYGIVDVYVPGLRKNANLKPHILAWVLMHADVDLDTTDDIFLAYKELTISGLEVDHLCRNRACFNPDHGEVVTRLVNCERRDEANRGTNVRKLTPAARRLMAMMGWI